MEDDASAAAAAALEPTFVIDLVPPLTVDGATIEQLKLHEPNGLQVRQAELLMAQSVNVATQRAAHIKLVAAVSGVPQAGIGALPISILNRAADYLQAFVDTFLEPFADPAPELVIDLDPPLEVKDKGKFERLELREPDTSTVAKAEQLVAKGFNIESLRRYKLKLVADVSGVPLPIVELMPIRVLNRGAAYLQGFIESGRRTGAS